MKTIHFLLAATLITGSFLACSKEKDKAGTTNLAIHLTDNPYDASEVNVDIAQVRVRLANAPDSGEWIDLDTRAGIYNLLDYQHDVDTLIAHTTLPTGTLTEIRFVLGSNNSIRIDDTLYPLTIPSGSESGLKIKLNKALRSGLDSVIVDFDAALSILQEGTGDYKLKPVIKIK